ncbi:uncharacterized protein LOC108603495 isoform X2 [Drosophila busckii]|uniref:uncharacterized protein LOC108603495 isoform X2 n=1 Tax=Drosophila busckii TaxID=30019 RepID=UPI00083EB41A|nr:uncharacterized protein LOC108603495 isoform X2 [Drosophila busckii]
MNSSNLNDLRSYSRHWLTEFIEQYQEEECLWQPKHQDYSNHAARNLAYDKLVEKLKEVEPNPDRAMVVRKINSLRSAFRREFRKSSSKSDYETRLWYYDKLLFIAEHKPKRNAGECKPKRELHISFDDDDSMDYEDESHHTTQSHHIETIVATSGDEGEEVVGESNSVVVSSQGTTISTISVTPADCVALVKNEQQQHHHHHHQQQELETHQRLSTAAQSGTPGTHAVKVLEITSLDSNSQREIQQQLQHLHQANGHGQPVSTIQIGREHFQPLFSGTATTAYTTAAPTQSHRQDDEYDAIGVNVASKLRSINHTQRIIAEKLISDVLFNAQLDNLTVDSALTQ